MAAIGGRHLSSVTRCKFAKAVVKPLIAPRKRSKVLVPQSSVDLLMQTSPPAGPGSTPAYPERVPTPDRDVLEDGHAAEAEGQGLEALHQAVDPVPLKVVMDKEGVVTQAVCQGARHLYDINLSQAWL